MSVDIEAPPAGVENGLVDRARGLVPLLTANAARTDRERRVPAENLHALTEAGLFRMMAPRRFGGFEAGLTTKVRVVSELARGCGSTGWTVSLLTGGSWFVGMMNEQAQRDVWAEGPDAKVAVAVAPIGTATPVEGGYRISGQWAYSSGSQHADWVLVGVPIQNGGDRPDPFAVLIPRGQVEIEDTWFVTGMRGTGSNTIVARNVFVPSHRAISQSEILAGHVETPFDGEAPYHVPFAAAVITDLAGPQLGLARAALDLVVEQAGRRGVTATCYTRQAEAPTIQLAVARAASALDTAETLVERVTEAIDRAGRDRTRLDLVGRARLRSLLARGVTEAREAIRESVTIAGASAFAESHPLQRIWRDSEVASRHAGCNPDISAEVYGRALLGITEPITPLV